ncbi:hypothetical protein OPQ81_009081 [Rhizoctonia solani]|nr:hypothetical protein OPQ81_009081 [Rhizoctonia solani]
MGDSALSSGIGSKTPRLVVIIGGRGLLGSHLAKYYHNRDFHVRIADFQYHREHGTGNYFADSFAGNLCDLDFCKYVVRGAEIVLHCGEFKNKTNAYHSDDDETINYRANHLMTQNLLTSACQAGVKAFIYALTLADPKLQPMSCSFLEEGRLTHFGPASRTFVNLEKQHPEHLALSYSNQMVIRIARFGILYGPIMSWNAGDDEGPAALVRYALAAKHLVQSGCRPTIRLTREVGLARQFIHVDDAVQTMVSFVEGGKSDHPLTIRSNQPISHLELAKLAL